MQLSGTKFDDSEKSHIFLNTTKITCLLELYIDNENVLTLLASFFETPSVAYSIINIELHRPLALLKERKLKVVVKDRILPILTLIIISSMIMLNALTEQWRSSQWVFHFLYSYFLVTIVA